MKDLTRFGQIEYELGAEAQEVRQVGDRIL